jgi:cathepsin A (carboxypeptidase C)
LSNKTPSNTPGNIRAFDAIPWTRQSVYRQSQFKLWFYQGASGNSKTGGLTKGVDRLVFVGVDDAGHDVPASQPVAALDILNRWLKGQKPSTPG